MIAMLVALHCTARQDIAHCSSPHVPITARPALLSSTSSASYPTARTAFAHSDREPLPALDISVFRCPGVSALPPNLCACINIITTAIITVVVVVVVVVVGDIAAVKCLAAPMILEALLSGFPLLGGALKFGVQKRVVSLHGDVHCTWSSIALHQVQMHVFPHPSTSPSSPSSPSN